MREETWGKSLEQWMDVSAEIKLTELISIGPPPASINVPHRETIVCQYHTLRSSKSRKVNLTAVAQNVRLVIGNLVPCSDFFFEARPL